MKTLKESVSKQDFNKQQTAASPLAYMLYLSRCALRATVRTGSVRDILNLEDEYEWGIGISCACTRVNLQLLDKQPQIGQIKWRISLYQVLYLLFIRKDWKVFEFHSRHSSARFEIEKHSFNYHYTSFVAQRTWQKCKENEIPRPVVNEEWMSMMWQCFLEYI